MKVVIVGGGFGGVRAGLLLANKPGIEVTLISDQAYFEYHAALYRSATGRSPLEVAIPLSNFFDFAKNIEVVEDMITDIDDQQKSVISQEGSVYKYDRLILALGNVTEYFNTSGLDKYTYSVKTIHQALRLKRHLHQQLISAESYKNYVVIGGGATGVELSAELVAYLRRIRKKHKINHQFEVSLVEAADKVLPTMPDDFTTAAAHRLQKLGVKLRLNTSVKSVTGNSVELLNTSINSHTVVWTAGVANNPLFKRHTNIFRLGHLGKVEVDSYLAAAPDIYVIGDSAVTPYSGMAQTALRDADLVVKNILRTVKGRSPIRYQPKKPVYAIPIGPHWAAVLWGGVRIYGRLGWALRRLADLRLYVSFLSVRKAISVWRYGFIDEEACDICRH